MYLSLVSGLGKISANTADYVLGGQNAAPGEIKWQVSRQIKNTYNTAVTSILTLQHYNTYTFLGTLFTNMFESTSYIY